MKMNEYLKENGIRHINFLEKLGEKRGYTFYQGYRQIINKKKNLDHFNSKKTLLNFQEFFDMFGLVVKVEDVKELLLNEQNKGN